jgi:hypothetical protein
MATPLQAMFRPLRAELIINLLNEKGNCCVCACLCVFVVVFAFV